MNRLLCYLLWTTALLSTATADDQFLLARAGENPPPVQHARSTESANAETMPDSKIGKPAGSIGLEDAIRHALERSPRLKAVRAAEAASRGERRQAGTLPNPVVGFSKQNIKATGAYKVISPGQSVYEVSQLVEVGGKISARKDIADKAVRIAGLESQAAALDLIRDVTIAYADAVAAEENVRLAREQKALAQDVLEAVSERVNAAASPLIQKSRAEVERASAAVGLDSAERERAINFKVLATLLGEDESSFKLDKTAFFTRPTKNESAGPETLKGNPDLAKFDTALEQSKAKLALEKANALPDPTLNAGLIRIPSANGSALVVGVTLPIPVLNANRGNIEKARSEVTRTEEDNHHAVLSLNADFTRAEQQMMNADVVAKTLSTEILPSARKAFALARAGYGQGRLPYLEVLDAQCSLFVRGSSRSRP